MSHLQAVLLGGWIAPAAQLAAAALATPGKGGRDKGRPDRFGPWAAVVFLNFAVFWCVASLIGGDALNGKVVRGAYFLRDHGRYTQVGVGTWLYSAAHAVVTIVSVLGLMVWRLVQLATGKAGLSGRDDDLNPRGRGTV